MADTKTVVGASVGVALFFILFSAAVMPSYNQAQGTYNYEEVNTTGEWESAINADASQNYTIGNDTLTLTETASVVQTVETPTQGEHETLTVDARHLSGDLTLTLYDDNNSQRDTASTTGESDITLDVSNYTSSSYYLEWTSSTTGDAEVDTYSTTGESSRSGEIQAFLLIALLLLVVGLAMKFYDP